jgi:hypothetical protein
MIAAVRQVERSPESDGDGSGDRPVLACRPIPAGIALLVCVSKYRDTICLSATKKHDSVSNG